jgi:hypothetical protein
MMIRPAAPVGPHSQSRKNSVKTKKTKLLSVVVQKLDVTSA